MVPELNIILEADDQVPVATGWGVPIRWNGHVADLPSGYTDTTKRAVEGRERAALHIGREHDCGTYTEPNVWVQHR